MSQLAISLMHYSNLNSAIVTIAVGPTQRLFAAHETVLSKSPFFAEACRAQFFETSGKRIDLLTEEPEVFSAVLEYLYKGDYSPRLTSDKRTGAWTIENDGGPKEITVHLQSNGTLVLKDTLLYVCCVAHGTDLADQTTVLSTSIWPARIATSCTEEARTAIRCSV